MSELNFESVKDAKDRPVLYERPEPVPAPLYERETVQRTEELAAALERGDQPNTELSLDEAVQQVKRNREVDGDPFAEQRLPIVERRYGDDGPTPEYRPDFIGDDPEERRRDGLSLRKLNEDLAQTRKTELQIARANQGLTPEEIRIAEQFDDYAREHVPADPIGLVDQETLQLKKPLRDNEPVRAEHAITIEDMRKEVAAYRDADANFKAMALQAWNERKEQQRLSEAASQLQVAPEPSPPQATPVVSHHHQPAPQPEPEPLAQAAQLYSAAINANEQERHAAAAVNTLRTDFARKYPETQNVQVYRELAQRNPNRLLEIQSAAGAYQQRIDGFMQAGRAATAAREASEQRIRAIQDAEVRGRWHEYRGQQDAKFLEYAPEFSQPRTSVVLQANVRQMMKDVGFSEDELRAAWSGETGFSLRDHRAQALAYDAYRYRDMMARAKTIANNRAQIPSVQAPGMSQPRGAANLSEIQSIERQLEGAVGETALRLATRLHQLRRGAA